MRRRCCASLVDSAVPGTAPGTASRERRRSEIPGMTLPGFRQPSQDRCLGLGPAPRRCGGPLFAPSASPRRGFGQAPPQPDFFNDSRSITRKAMAILWSSRARNIILIWLCHNGSYHVRAISFRSCYTKIIRLDNTPKAGRPAGKWPVFHLASNRTRFFRMGERGR